ncbi:aldehyde dehydrogenase family 16 member A1 isoform X3 [Eurytemora carolleeae]|uniref:aldehyde dehydrogenase family 16 member A1 isoform X3 n=1 Tax=Eurytemora carolleeae TaxID=1294199 RepID=UPI000C75EB58|nr:aldehyde dehydrogenase family 16 member A1 isoform X3 [Eurytemora carolleeae]|eukprot:XP_023342279.1 aldehyde dehydrogenase family 16 member A1-like isoform X3 [Eurytemora affinis]
MESMLKTTTPSVSDIFNNMEYGPASESDKVAEKWLDEHDRKFGLFINNTWVHPEGRNLYATKNPSNGKTLASTTQGTAEDVDTAVRAAKEAHKSWSKLSGYERAKHLYSVARHVQKHSRLIAVVEALDNGKSIRETRDADIPVVIRHLYYYAGWAQMMEETLPGWESVGVIGAIVPWNFPLMLLTWKVAPALAMGNTVLLKPATYTRLSALLFAEICAEAGLPAGVFNVVTGGGAMGQLLAEHSLVDKVAFTGSTEIGKVLRMAIAGTGKKISLELGGKSPVVVYHNADLDSAVESVVDAIWFNQGQVCSAGSKLLVQEPVFDVFISKLKTRLSKFRIGNSMDKTVDMAAIVDESQRKSIAEYVEDARLEGADVFQTEAPPGCFYPPTLITGVNSASRVVMEEIFGPVLVALPFRTAKEAIALANNTLYGLGASVHSDQLTLALETAKHIQAGAVWINCHNQFDAAAGFGGFKQSGFGRDGGREGLFEYAKPAWVSCEVVAKPDVDFKKFGSSDDAAGPAITGINAAGANSPVDRTYKLYYGGAQKRPDGNYSRIIRSPAGAVLAQVGESNRKDVRNAVEAAKKAQPGWAKKTPFNRQQILYYIAENLEIRKAEFVTGLIEMTGVSLEAATKEVERSIERLFYWAGYADKYGGTVQETQLYGSVIKIHEPLGVIGIVCPDLNPLLSFISLLAPAIARSNTVVIVPSEQYPLVALGLYQIFETSDLPAGVVNILTGSRDHITKPLAEHQDVDGVWYFNSREGSVLLNYDFNSCLIRT